MKILTSKERPALSSILIIIGLMLLFAAVVTVILGLSVGSSFSYDKPDVSVWLKLMLTQGLTSLIMFVGAALFYWYKIEDKTWEDFNWNEFPTWQVLVLAVLAHFAFMPLNGFLAQYNENMKLPASWSAIENIMKGMEVELAKITKFLITFNTPWQFLIAFFVIAVVAGLGEELIFRGLILRKIWRGTGNIHLAIWLSAIIFSAIHFQFYGFVPRMLLGALFGYMYYFTGNLGVPIVAHILNNGFIVFLMYLNNVHLITIDTEKMDKHLPIPVVVASLFLTVGLLWKLKQDSNEKLV